MRWGSFVWNKTNVMKHLSFVWLLCSIFHTNPLPAQNTTTWFPSGATWGYGYESLNGPGQEFLENVGTEVIGGQTCAKIHVFGYHLGWPSGPFDEGFRYFFARNDSVFLWQGAAFKLLYDFNRMAGDTFDLTNSAYDRGLVLNTGDTVWNGIPIRFQDLKLTNYPFWPDGDTLYLNTRIYERLGGTHLIHWDDESPITEIQYSLGCYRDEAYPQMDCQLDFDPNYVGFPNVGTSVWSEQDGGWCGYRGYQYKIEGDSVIFGVGQGKKVYFRNTYNSVICPDPHNEIIHEPFRLIGLLDQSVPYKKVYFTRLTADPSPFSIWIESDSLPLNEYHLLYDFDLKIGDTLHWKPKPNAVEAVDSIQLDNGTWRRTFVFKPNPFDPFNDYFWIEGIGSNRGLFGAFANIQLTDVRCDLQCFRTNNQVLYSTVEAVFCDSVTVSTHEPNYLQQALHVFPNPSSGEVNLEIPASEIPAMLRILDVQGRELERLEVTTVQSQIDLSALRRNAVLFLQIQGASGQSAGRVLRLE